MTEELKLEDGGAYRPDRLIISIITFSSTVEQWTPSFGYEGSDREVWTVISESVGQVEIEGGSRGVSDSMSKEDHLRDLG